MRPLVIFGKYEWQSRSLLEQGKRGFFNKKQFNMPVKIRLQRKGRKKQPFYHIVVADSRAPRDGRFIEKLGVYNPMTKPATIDIDRNRAYEWLTKGAQPTDTVRAMLRFKGVLYRKHLMRGVKKGALTQEQADAKWQAWIDAKEAKISERRDATAAEKLNEQLKRFGTAPVIETPVEEQEAVAQDIDETLAEAAERKDAEAAGEDLTKIEGIGPKIMEVLHNADIKTFAQLAETSADSIKELLDKAEGNFAAHTPATWPDQAKMAAAGEWDKLKAWQDELDGGKPAE